MLNDVSNGKQPGVDGLSYEFFKHAQTVLNEELCTLFNLIMKTGHFPNQWGEAIISLFNT